MKTCGGAGGWLDCTSEHYGLYYEVTETDCDGLDNDCNGATDDFVDAPSCVLTTGICAEAVKRCGGAAGWLECTPQDYGPSYQVAETRCDGEDNDCDGATDDTLVDAPSCALTAGVCAAAVKRCGGAAGWLACTVPDYGPSYQVAETRCEGLDNDCDGATDDILEPPSCALTAGVCSSAVKRCGGAGGWLDCTVSDYGSDYEVEETRCDDLDNDCDGATDVIVAAPRCSLSVGVCASGVKRCQDQAWQECLALDYGPDYEVAETRCDGLDNDCDGIVDDVSGCVSTVAGIAPPGYLDGQLMAARFFQPARLLLLANGDLLVAEHASSLIRRVNLTTGMVSTEAGTPFVPGDADGPPGVGTLYYPQGMFELSNGTVLIADGNAQVRALINGNLSWVAGSPHWGFQDGPADQAMFASVSDVIKVDNLIFIADMHNCAVRTYDGTNVNTAAGTGGVCGYRDGAAATAQFGFVTALAQDPSGNIYIAENEGRIRVLWRSGTAVGTVTTLAGGSESGCVDGAGSEARLNAPLQMAATPEGLVFTDSGNHRIRFVTWGGQVSTEAGTGLGLVDGPALQAKLACPSGLAVSGDIAYLAETCSHRLRKLEHDTLTGIAGGPLITWRDGPRDTAILEQPFGIAADHSTGLVYFTDSNHVVRTLSPEGMVATLAGSAGNSGLVDGRLEDARFAWPRALRQRSDGALILADFGNATIRLIVPTDNSVTTLAGDGSCGSEDGPAGTARFCMPTDIALGSSDEVYVAEEIGRIRKIVNGQVTTLNGSYNSFGCEDDPDGSRDARFGLPVGLALGPDGLLYVADRGCCTIRTVEPATGAVQTVLGIPFQCRPASDGPTPGKTLASPGGIAFVGGTLFFVEIQTGILRTRSNGALATIAGFPWRYGAIDGLGSAARFTFPKMLSPAPGGGLYIADADANRIRRFQP
ncbi:MAG: hypothetical protein HY901_36895 [Deltaproteobacteria bacterium]|nr:hypothetical protein [Deltaproteobacteria bacterium]